MIRKKVRYNGTLVVVVINRILKRKQRPKINVKIKRSQKLKINNRIMITPEAKITTIQIVTHLRKRKSLQMTMTNLMTLVWARMKFEFDQNLKITKNKSNSQRFNIKKTLLSFLINFKLLLTNMFSFLLFLILNFNKKQM